MNIIQFCELYCYKLLKSALKIVQNIYIHISTYFYNSLGKIVQIHFNIVLKNFFENASETVSDAYSKYLYSYFNVAFFKKYLWENSLYKSLIASTNFVVNYFVIYCSRMLSKWFSDK